MDDNVQAHFSVGFRGYDQHQVNKFLRSTEKERHRLAKENAELKEKLKSTDLIVLRSAQDSSDENAKRYATEIINSALSKSKEIEVKTKTTILELEKKIADCESRISYLQAVEEEYRTRLKAWAQGLSQEIDFGRDEESQGYGSYGLHGYEPERSSVHVNENNLDGKSDEIKHNSEEFEENDTIKFDVDLLNKKNTSELDTDLELSDYENEYVHNKHSEYQRKKVFCPPGSIYAPKQ